MCVGGVSITISAGEVRIEGRRLPSPAMAIHSSVERSARSWRLWTRRVMPACPSTAVRRGLARLRISRIAGRRGA